MIRDAFTDSQVLIRRLADDFQCGTNVVSLVGKKQIRVIPDPRPGRCPSHRVIECEGKYWANMYWTANPYSYSEEQANKVADGLRRKNRYP